MSVDDDHTDWLPKPPPPRPARRDAAIDAALRKFDGIDEPAPAVPQRPSPSWGRARRNPLGLVLSGLLIFVIGVPAALIAIRDQAPTPEGVASPAEMASPTVQPVRRAAPPPVAKAVPPAPAPVARVPQAPPRPEQPSSPPGVKKDVRQSLANNEPALQIAPPPARAPAAPIAAAPPAPPPPPPPSPPAETADRARSEDGQIVVTGSIVRRTEEKPNSFALKAKRQADPNAAFVSKLQSAVKANDRDAIVGLIAFPLRVNSGGTSKLYRDADAVERDFDRIFTPKVRKAILKQRPDQIFVRDQGAMIGSGEAWFDRSCPNAACSPAGPVRITAINP